jgi:hypothetical protein
MRLLSHSIRSVLVAELTRAARNPNVMAPAARAALAANVRDMGGLLQPILLEHDGPNLHVLDGHHRLDAAEASGALSVDAVVVEGPLSPEERSFLTLSMNRLRGEFNLGTVAEMFTEMRDEGWSLEGMTATGFDAAEVKALLGAGVSADPTPGEGGGMPDDAPSTADRPHILEVSFASAKELTTVKRLLRKAAGPTKDITRGLRAVLGLES